ncbi:SET domain-containing protein-lysine N-methyltransferase [Acinetobacter indicus]|uniref:SET domain-containing protein-lysine N-methyltransferase n=1 Tax=Acinetobacter indicus TaxID=756892 RepID=UPI00209B63B9|nr:SET domain-containing protein-lysine N-methyltransferase [Acinetobacter indicus]MCO8100119.1 SET domain-containing protein-lysine N-methyltransferase [Acinetobacter indicus]MCO8105636.1 SET domain-containing protein-lysine N-methyltransferase [Acinetobacter indicus]MCO8111310.1 SET domain-containing protein-lysine N-methyltransferase [Acinetobacter indicus]
MSNLIVADLEKEMLEMPQADCPVAHHFGPGIYIREVTLPAGIFAVGHAQKYEHLNIMLTGKVAIVDDGAVRVLEAPMIFTGKPGRKVGYVLETCVWQNVYATEETNIDALEAYYLDKSENWKAYDKEQSEIAHALNQHNRDDYAQVLKEFGFDAATARQQAQDESDQIDMPTAFKAVVQVRDSNIEGKGLFLSWHIAAGQIIAPARIEGKRTPAGRYVNHSVNPNCMYVADEKGDIYLMSLRDIEGCKGGGCGEELTVNYRQALTLNLELSTCQE